MHIDVNNAFLSWTAIDLLKSGYKIDIRTIPSVIGGFITEISNIKEVITLSNNILIYIFVAFTITIIVTYIALKIFERILKKEKIYMFGYYTMILGLILLIYCFKTGVI